MLPAHVVRLGRGVGSIGRNLLICLMRTTLNIDDELYRQIKATAALRGCSVTSLVEESLRVVLREHVTEMSPMPLSRRSSGLTDEFRSSGITLADSGEMLSYVDEHAT